MGLFDKLKSKLSGASAEVSPEGLNAGAARPALRYNNPRNPEGPHFVVFDELRHGRNGEQVVVLNLENTAASDEANDRFLSALDAIAQNEVYHCYVLLTDADHAAFDSFIDSAQSTHRGALARVHLAVG
jgi:hypothetical protein